MTTWRCPNCGYAQDFEMTEDMARRHFPEILDLKAGECPSCREGELRLIEPQRRRYEPGGDKGASAPGPA